MKIAINSLEKQLGNYPIVDMVKVEFDECIENAYGSLGSLSDKEAKPFKQIAELVSRMFAKYL